MAEKGLARVEAPAHLAAVMPAFDRDQIELIKHTVAKGTSDDELQLFMATCQRTGLDPFQRQIYAIMRRSKDKSGAWVNTMTIQTGIDGYRLIASRNPNYAGQTPPEWCGKDGVWRDVWLEDEPPAAARVGIFHRQYAQPTYAVALWREYAQYKDEYIDGKKTGNKILNEFWMRMPAGQLAKCAEALGLRKAFPNDMSGVYVKEEMDQADSYVDTTATVRETPPPAVASPKAPPDKRADTTPITNEMVLQLRAQAKKRQITAEGLDMIAWHYYQADRINLITAGNGREIYSNLVDAKSDDHVAGYYLAAHDAWKAAHEVIDAETAEITYDVEQATL